MSDLQEWQDVVDKRLCSLRDWAEAIDARGDDRSTRLDALEAGAKGRGTRDIVAVPVVTLRTIGTCARDARRYLGCDPYSLVKAKANIDSLLAIIDKLLQPVVRVELNPEAGSAAAIQEEIDRIWDKL